MSQMLIDRALLEQALAALDAGLKLSPQSEFHDRLRAALEQEEQEPVAWSTRERFYEALDRAVGNVRQEMRIKTVTMRRKDHDIALPIIDAYSGHVLVGDLPRREWQSLSEDELTALGVIHSRYQEESLETGGWFDFARAIAAALKERNHG
jgi:hypothetical protein